MDVLTERTANIVLDDDDDDELENEQLARKDRRMTKSKSRRRRRSSARFLHLGGDKDDDYETTPAENLGEVYQKAIRMNAENRIKASNSWNLNLIDHMDRFLMPNQNNSSSNKPVAPLEDTLGPTTGVNFTKASCTLDASVKIYSYRVDDVHLTSYKVLANLNRTDNGKKNKKASQDLNEDANDSDDEGRSVKKKSSASVNTLESNLANINIHNLDAAFDIDPLFHKMSKTFDEGGAKGLLLANLGVSSNGCNIVFDSTLDDEEEAKHEEAETNSDSQIESKMLDVSSLTAKLESSLAGQSIENMQLVPQLASLRADFFQLHREGFVDKLKPRSKRYAAPQEEEQEADRSIHVEAIERSRASMAEMGRSALHLDDDDDSFGDDDAGGFASDDFGGGDDDDGFGESFIHDGDHRFSSASFQATFEASQPPSQATVLLDAIADGNIAGSNSNYEFFNIKALESLQGNQWAGAAHWKKGKSKRQAKATATNGKTNPAGTTTKRKGRTEKSKKKDIVLIDINKPVDLKELLKKAPKGKKGSNPLQMTKAAITKASKNENLLPLDAGLKIESLTTLFLRPNTKIMDFASSKSAPIRNVGFGGVETWGGDDNSFGYDDGDDGPGYNFGGGDDDFQADEGDFVVPELEGIRKVEKVSVGYATVAKKVDVKRLKKDLWEELERTLEERRAKQDELDNTVEAIEVDAAEEGEDESVADMEAVEEEANVDTPEQRKGPLSFQDTVREMQATQSQIDVTLPFYFICVLHLANEKGLALESTGLEDFIIHSS